MSTSGGVSVCRGELCRVLGVIHVSRDGVCIGGLYMSVCIHVLLCM